MFMSNCDNVCIKKLTAVCSRLFKILHDIFLVIFKEPFCFYHCNSRLEMVYDDIMLFLLLA